MLPPREGEHALTPAARESTARFADAEGSHVDWRPRRRFSRYERGLIRTAHRLHLGRLAQPLERRQAALTHFEPQLGNLLLRWAMSIVAKRYAAVERV